MKFYDYKKNNDLKPEDFPAGSGTSVWWRCENNHSWKAPFERIAKGSGCSKCSLQTSFPEIRLYSEIKVIFEDAEWRYKLEKRIELDVFLPTHLICLEYDGNHYHDNDMHDKEKNNYLISKGIKVIRLREKPLSKINDDDIDFSQKLKKDLDKIYINKLLIKMKSICTDDQQLKINDYLNSKNYLNNEEFKRITSFLPKPIPEKSLAEVNKELCLEWNLKKNSPLTPEMFEPKSGKKVWWICKHGHEWESTIDKRSLGRKCPYCSNKKVGYGNSLIDNFPSLSEEWVPELNEPKKPDNVTCGSYF